MLDVQLLLSLAEHGSLIVTGSLILLTISPVQVFGGRRKSRFTLIYLTVFFGVFGIIGTYTGNQIFNSFANLRAMSVISAGLYGGPVVGTGAGLIAGLHRLSIDPSGFSSIPCALATILQGIGSGFLSRKLGRYRNDWRAAALICFVAEGFHMLLVLAISRPLTDAIELVSIIAFPMMATNPIGAALFIHLTKMLFKKREEHQSIQARNVLAIANETVGHFRCGLTRSSARETADIIFRHLSVAAVSITDRSVILAHAGEGGDHHRPGQPILTAATSEVIEDGRPRFLKTVSDIGCHVPDCPFHSAIIIPLKKNNHILGTLKLYGTRDITLDTVKFKIAQGLTDLFSTQFELEDLQIKEKLLARTTIRHLQSQINPHFLFNSLNTIASFCRTNPDRSRELVLDLASYMRKSLNASKGFITLRDELKQVQAYLAIEKARFGDRITVRMDVPGECENWPIPPLIIQPLVENAIRHGVLATDSGGNIDISVSRAGGELQVSISDDGAGMPVDQFEAILSSDPEAPHGSDGVGLSNTNKRLEQIYGPGHKLSWNACQGKGTCISFTLPKTTAAA